MSKEQWASFGTTHWSLVDGAAHIDSQRKRQALTELVRRYLPPLKSHLMHRKRLGEHRAEDLLQGFLYSKVLVQDLFSAAQRERGRFRTFLLTALDRFLISEIRAQSAAKRSPEKSQPIDDLSLADSTPTPDQQFDLEWASQVLSQATDRLKQECRRLNRADVWSIFESRILNPLLNHEQAAELEDLARLHNLSSTAQASNILITAKRAFARALRSVVAEYEKESPDIDAEIAQLQAIFARRRS